MLDNENCSDTIKKLTDLVDLRNGKDSTLSALFIVDRTLTIE